MAYILLILIDVRLFKFCIIPIFNAFQDVLNSSIDVMQEVGNKIKILKEKPLKFESQFSKFWTEIVDETYQFDRGK